MAAMSPNNAVGTSLIERAIKIAVEAHASQRDKQDKPYLLHVFRVAMAGRTEEEQIVGFLHDVVEDTSYTLDDLRGFGFPAPIVDAVDALTRRSETGESYTAFIERVATNDLARRVKLHDLRDNLSRIGGVPPATAAGLGKRYGLALARLSREEG